MLRSRRLPVLSFMGLLACSADPSAAQDVIAASPTTPASTAPSAGVTAPPGFVAMDTAGVERLRATTVRGTATAAEIDGWLAPQGGATGLVISMNIRHAVRKPVYGHTLRSWVAHNLRALEGNLAAFDAEAVSPTLQDDPGSDRAVLTRYALPLPGGGSLRVWARHWLSPDGHLVEASCQCAGTGCTEPPACILPQPPADALPRSLVLGAESPATTLTTVSGAGRVEAPPHLTPLPDETKARLEASGSEDTPRRTAQRVQGLSAPDGSGVFLTEATWCSDPPACDAQTLAENRRKAEVASLRKGGTLRSVETHASPHDALPTYGFEVDQHDGFWTRTTFWNEGDAVREVSCSCAGLSCALVQRSCTVNPG